MTFVSYQGRAVFRTACFVALFIVLLVLVSPLNAQTVFSDNFGGSYPGSWYIGHDGGGGSYAWAWPNGYAHEYSNPSGGQYYYPNDLHVYMERRNVSLVGYSSAILSFYRIVDTESGYDYFTVNVRDQSGAWHEMLKLSGETDPLNWTYEEVDLSQFCGQSGLYVQFRFDSDGSVSGSPYDGVFIDVVSLDGATADPDLEPYQRSGWDDNLVISDQVGTTTSASTIYDNENIYVDYCCANTGGGDAGHFRYGLYIDGTRVKYVDMDSLAAGYNSAVLDSNVGPLSAGWHTFKIVCDYNGEVSESDEGNNEYERYFYITPATLILSVDYDPPDGSQAIVGQSQTVTVSVGAEIFHAGVLQVWMFDADYSTQDMEWVYISSPQSTVRDFELSFTESGTGARDYSTYVQFRPGATTGPLDTCMSSDTTWSGSGYTINWENQSTNPQLVDADCYVTPGSTAPDSRITVYYRIYNPGSSSVSVGLGCSIRLHGTSTVIDDSDDDLYRICPPGYSTQYRYFDVPSGAYGEYDVAWGIWETIGVGTPWELLWKENELTVVGGTCTIQLTINDTNGLGLQYATGEYHASGSTEWSKTADASGYMSDSSSTRSASAFCRAKTVCTHIDVQDEDSGGSTVEWDTSTFSTVWGGTFSRTIDLTNTNGVNASEGGVAFRETMRAWDYANSNYSYARPPADIHVDSSNGPSCAGDIIYFPNGRAVLDNGAPSATAGIDDTMLHEYGHALQHAAYGGTWGRPSGCTCSNHGGTSNDCSFDALIEGWADYFPVMLYNHINTNDHHYDWSSSSSRLDIDSNTNTSTEERDEWSFAGVLFDIYNTIDDGENKIWTVMMGGQTPETVEEFFQIFIDQYDDDAALESIYEDHGMNPRWLTLSKTSIDFGDSATTDSFTIQRVGWYGNTGTPWNQPDWTITENVTWITSVSPSSGTTETETDTISVTIDRSALAVGLNTAYITVTPGHYGRAQVITVTAINQTGTVSVNVTPDSASWTIPGPSGFEGNGQTYTGDRTFSNAPIGSYTWTGQPLSGYNTPSPETKTLSSGGTISFNKTWTAQSVDYTLSVNSSGASGVSISSSTGHGGTTNYTQTVASGTTVTLTAPSTADGKDFTGWTGDITSSNNTISFTMNNHRTVTADFIVTTEPEIRVTQGGIEILSGNSFEFGNVVNGSTLNKTFTIINDGTADLTLNGSPIITKSGTNSDQFGIVQQPGLSTLIPGNSTTFILSFSPTSLGQKTASISIDNNDSDENPYIITLSGTAISAPIPEVERNALIDLYNGTNGDTWTDNSGWKTPPLYTDGFAMPGTEGDWYGITVVNDHVTMIDLQGKNLTGSIPASIGDISYLDYLRLNGNQITGPIPTSIGNLTNLRYLYLYSNQLTGNIPSEIGNLSNLVNLYLQFNQLTGSIPPEIGNLSDLWYLYLYSNQLTGEIPPEIGNLSNLRTLYLAGNQLTGSIPATIGNLSYLDELRLNVNQLSGSIPAEIGGLSYLTRLYLYSNNLEGNIPTELGNLSSIQTIRLESNMLRGNIPMSLINLTSLADNASDLGYNALYTDNSSLRDFLNTKDPDWESTQTIAPADVSASALTSSSIQVSWTPIPFTDNPGGYRVLYSTTSGGDYTFFDITTDKTAASMTVTGLVPGTPYYFVVQTRTETHNDNQNTVDSEYSNEVAATPPVPVFIISGIVTSGGSGLQNVVLNGLPGNPVTDSNGNYTATVDYGWSGTVTPTLAGYTFTEPSTTYTNVTSNQTTNYTATIQTYTISGTVTSGGTGLENVLMGGLPGDPVTDSQGNYAATVDYGWSGTVTPTLAGYTFTEPSTTHTNVTSNQTTNYTAALLTYTISGTVTSSGTGLLPIRKVIILLQLIMAGREQ
jgi:uncharacterized repeat protein (TIGR02543 family)